MLEAEECQRRLLQAQGEPVAGVGLRVSGAVMGSPSGNIFRVQSLVGAPAPVSDLPTPHSHCFTVPLSCL